MRRKAERVLQDILHDYSAFAVSTIDRFFQQTLKAFSREIGQFASYQVELDKDSLVAESVDRVLDSLTEESGPLLSWLTTKLMEQIESGGRYSLDANLLDIAKRLMSPQRRDAMAAAGVDEETMC
jgi:ATP-dependent exoDNAse (exonuclease V) beta subunit